MNSSWDVQLKAALHASDARKADIQATRERAQANPELCAVLLADAQRRGQKAINWPEYFRNSGMY